MHHCAGPGLCLMPTWWLASTYGVQYVSISTPTEPRKYYPNRVVPGSTMLVPDHVRSKSPCSARLPPPAALPPLHSGGIIIPPHSLALTTDRVLRTEHG
jgi:hypothetical protein